MKQIDFMEPGLIANNKQQFAQLVTEANSDLFMMATQICALAVLVGSDELVNYINKYTIETVTVIKFIHAARSVDISLGFSIRASNLLEVETRFKCLFTPFIAKNKYLSTPIHEALLNARAFGQCPFQHATRILYLQFGKWIRILPVGCIEEFHIYRQKLVEYTVSELEF